MGLSGIRSHDLSGKGFDLTASASPVLRAFLQDTKTIGVVPMTTELLAAESMCTVDARHGAGEYTSDMSRLTHRSDSPALLEQALPRRCGGLQPRLSGLSFTLQSVAGRNLRRVRRPVVQAD